ncbi:MAG: flippase [Patescibacteria group bacterium]
MSLLRQVARNTALQFSGKLIGTALGFVVATILIRYLKDDLFGSYTTAMSYLQLFGIIMDLGLYVVLLKHIAGPDNKTGQLQNNIFTLRTVTAVTLLILAIIIVWFIPQYPLIVKWAVVILALNFFCITINQLFQAIFQHHLAMHWVAIAEVSSKVVLFASTLTVVYLTQKNFLVIIATVVLAGVVQTIVLWSASRRYTHLAPAFDLFIWKRVLLESWPIAVAIALNLIYFKSDTIILSLYYPQAVVGVYGVPYKILEVLITLPIMVVGLLLPILSQYFQAKNLPAFNKLYQRAFNLLWMMAAPVIAGGIVLAEPLMLLVAGNKFTDDPRMLGAIFRILILAIGAIYLGTLTGYVVVAINQQRTIIWGYAFVAGTALLGYFIFIPPYSYYGAAWVTVYSEVMMVLIATYIIYRHTMSHPALFSLLRITGAALLMAGVVYLIQAWPIVFVVLSGGVVYSIALLLMGGISKEDIKTLLQRQLA